MSAIHTRLMFCLVFAFVTHSRCLQFFMDTTPDGLHCGHLQCWADKIFTDPDIYTVFTLSIYRVTQSNSHIKLASMSIFDSDIFVDQTKINGTQATGNISDYHAELALGLQHDTDCLNVSYLCELEFANINSHHQMTQETVSPGSNEKCLSPAVVFNQFTKVAFEIKTHSDDLEKENFKLKQQIADLLNESHQVVNTSNGTPQITCSKGAPHNNAKEKFTLWNKVPALCDTETDGGGWVVIQRRTKGDVDFYRGWDVYKKGFGTPDTDFWIGNEVIHNLTLQGYTELRIDMEYQGRQYFAHYAYFNVDDETLNYRLNVSGYTGTAGDSLTYHSSMGYSTFDKDNDRRGDVNCAFNFRGAWWYRDCGYSSLNGQWGGRAGATDIWWHGATGALYSVTLSEMKVRRV